MSTTVIISFQAKPDQVETLLEFLSGLQTGLLEAGCLSVSLLQDQDDPTRCFEVEQWSSAEGHKRFVEGAASAGAFEPFEAMLAAPFTVNYLDTVKHSEV